MLLTVTAYSQDLKNNFYVKVLNEELQRNIKLLFLPDLEKPFFIAYDLRDQNAYTIISERGVVTSNIKAPVNNKSVSILLRVGNYHRNFDYMMYDGFFVNLPDENNTDEYRRLLWLETDKAYKNTSTQYSSFISSLNRVKVNQEELQLDDLSKIKPIVKDYGSANPINVNSQLWEKQLNTLSALFNNHPDITTSYCRLDANNYEDYLVTSEGTIIRKPNQSVTFRVYGALSDEDGNNYNSFYSSTVKNIDELPSFDVLQKEVKKVIENIRSKQKAKPFEGSYMGPVLYTKEAVNDIVNQCLAYLLSVKRKSILGYDNGETDYEDKLGQKLISSDLSLTAIPSLKTFNGRNTTGYFVVDDQGVQPPDSLTLIQNGILKALLNGRTPTRKFPVSGGFSQSFMGRNYNAGVLKFSSSRSIKNDSMQAKLVQLAKEEGLPEAYIVNDYNLNRAEIYKVDVASGKIEMVDECKIVPLNVKSLRRFVVASQEMQLNNTPEFSIIAPESIIVNEVEIEKTDNTTSPKPIVVTNPLLDKKTGNSNNISAKHKKASWLNKP